MIRLAVFDIDDTLTRGVSIWEMVYRLIGTWETVGARHLDCYRRGEIDYDEFARADAREFKGHPVSIIGEAAQRLSYAPGMDETFGELARRGVTTAFVSSSIGQFAEWLARRLGVPHAMANPLGVGGGGLLTGEITLDVPGTGKGAVLRALRERLGIPREEVLAVGDSALDLGLFEEAAVACCVAHAPEELRRRADVVLTGDSLAGILGVI